MENIGQLLLAIAGIALFCVYWILAFRLMKENKTNWIPKTSFQKFLFFLFWWIPMGFYYLKRFIKMIVNFLLETFEAIGKDGAHHV